MKKIWIIFIVIGILIFAVVLISRQKAKAPSFLFDLADTAIYYEDRAMHEEWGKITLEISKDGSSMLNKYKDLELKESYPFETSKAELSEILDAAEQNGFLSLRDEYISHDVMDGGIETMTIFYGDKSKTVTIVNANIDGFRLVTVEIFKLLNQKLGEDSYSFKGL